MKDLEHLQKFQKFIHGEQCEINVNTSEENFPQVRISVRNKHM